MTLAAKPQLPTTGVAFESVGVTCARAAIVALGVGLVEGAVVGARVHLASGGMAVANAALWVPAALVALVVGARLVPLMPDARRRNVAIGVFGALLVVSLVVALTGDPAWWRATPLEAVGAVGLAWAASIMRFEGPMRRPFAYVGIVLVALVQLFAHRWIDAHRALAGVLVDSTCVPRLMLRFVLRRYT